MGAVIYAWKKMVTVRESLRQHFQKSVLSKSWFRSTLIICQLPETRNMESLHILMANVAKILNTYLLRKRSVSNFSKILSRAEG